ncbi:MAG: hypothetical protein RLZZ15_1655 [Verrucomicrobiota bacterium]|jgi:hypothetical protein
MNWTRRPPDSVAFIARTHGLVGAIALGSVAVLHLVSRGLPGIAFGPRTYAIALGIAALYLVGGAMVWFGTPLGRFANLLCSLLYLARPGLGDQVWRLARSAEFKAHFDRRRPPTP